MPRPRFAPTPDPSPQKLTLPTGDAHRPASIPPPGDVPGDPLVVRPREFPGTADPATGPAGGESGNAPKRPTASLAAGIATGRTRRSRLRRWQRWRLLGAGFGLLVAGYLLGRQHARPVTVVPAKPTPVVALTATEQAELDNAFAALRAARYAEARQLFVALAQKHPQWKTLNNEIAIAALEAGDKLGFKKVVEEGEAGGTVRPDESRLLLSQLSMAAKDYESADRLLGESAGADPIRTEAYYYWGDCLLRWGKAKEAAEKFRAAQLRNIYPTAEALFQTKLWLAEVESGLEATDGTAGQIDQALTAERPTSPALFAAAARAVKAGQFAQAADYVTRARQVSEPATFRLMLQDPYFADQRWRPEFRAVYTDAFRATQ